MLKGLGSDDTKIDVVNMLTLAPGNQDVLSFQRGGAVVIMSNKQAGTWQPVQIPTQFQQGTNVCDALMPLAADSAAAAAAGTISNAVSGSSNSSSSSKTADRNIRRSDGGGGGGDGGAGGGTAAATVVAMPNPSCTNPPPANQRRDCGDVGTNPQTCAAAGCCWLPVSPNPGNAPWCYHPPNGPSPPSPPSPSPPSPPAPGGRCATVGANGVLEVDVTHGPRVMMQVGNF